MTRVTRRQPIGKKVYVGLSGGVDSSVSAALLLRQGYDVTGIFIKAWQPEHIPCTWKEDRLSAMRAAAAIGIPFVTWDMGEQYKRLVADEMIRGYMSGETPNPDILCNEKIKFGVFAERAFREGADVVATGHYAKIHLDASGRAHLMMAKDTDKDQTYFLARVSGDVLQKTMFPIGAMLKRDVRKLAKRMNLPTASRPDSQGLCFLGQLDMKQFLKEHIGHERGVVFSTHGDTLGFHDGAKLYTLGERHGFAVERADAERQPLYVVKKNIIHNTITVSPDARDAETKTLYIRDVHELYPGSLRPDAAYMVRYRYRQPLLRGKYVLGGNPHVLFDEPVAYASPGQSIVFYDKRECVGSGILHEVPVGGTVS